MGEGLSGIMADLDRHAGLFDLAGDLGEELTGVAADDVAETFDRESSPEGDRWPELTSEYARAKARLFPGGPIGVRTGHLRENLAGTPELAEHEAALPIGGDDVAIDRAGWMNDGSTSRFPRALGGLSAEGIRASDAALDDHFQKGV